MARKVILVGIGEIARSQHHPALMADPDWDLVATVSRKGRLDGIAPYTDLSDCLDAHPDVGVVSLCLPPVPRFDAARAALAAGRHVMLEKPPGATLAEVRELADLAAATGLTLFATWHSRMAAGVAEARSWLAGRRIRSVRIDWREDVRKWHPGQDWIWEAGGMGVLDPGINALSIATEILPAPFHLQRGLLSVPKGRQTPIAAELHFSAGVSAHFDWRVSGDEVWEIAVDTDDGVLRLFGGGEHLEIDGAARAVSGPGEYPALYRRMSELVASGRSDVDLEPMVHLSDIFTLSHRQDVAPFDWSDRD